MVSPNPNSACQQSQLFYYEYLMGETLDNAPADLISHIDQCHRCQEEIDRLRYELSDEEDGLARSKAHIRSTINANLKLHFSSVGQMVTCKMVRSFLPAWAIPTLKINIPTPITVHLDNCQSCSDDLKTIQQFNLNHSSLCRLSRLFSEELDQDTTKCEEAQKFILSIAAMDFSQTTASILNHVCKCPVCRGVLYSAREAMRIDLPAAQASGPFPCEEVRSSDIFDYVVPYGIEPADDEYAPFRESLTSHLRNCPNCLDKIQSLHKTVYAMMEREESGIITCFEMEESADEKVPTGPDNIYADWPIRVKVIDKNKAGEASIEPVTARKSKRQNVPPNWHRYIKPAAAAAVILIVLGLFFYTPMAGAFYLDRVYEALKNINNVHVSRSDPAKPEPIQEIWISRSLNIYLTRTEKEWVLWDIPNKVKKVKNTDTDSVEVASVAEDSLAGVKNYVANFMDLLPFPDISAVPEDFEWRRVPEEDVEVKITGAEVYDLIWAGTLYDGSIQYNKWRGYIDTQSYLPQRVEWYEKIAGEDEYILKSVSEIKYPDDSEVKAVIKDIFF